VISVFENKNPFRNCELIGVISVFEDISILIFLNKM
jgi:hypothetical protein